MGGYCLHASQNSHLCKPVPLPSTPLNKSQPLGSSLHSVQLPSTSQATCYLGVFFPPCLVSHFSLALSFSIYTHSVTFNLNKRSLHQICPSPQMSHSPPLPNRPSERPRWRRPPLPQPYSAPRSGQDSLTVFFPKPLKLLSKATSDLAVRPPSLSLASDITDRSLLDSSFPLVSESPLIPAFPPTPVAPPSSSLVLPFQVWVRGTFFLGSLLFLLCSLLLTNFPGVTIIEAISGISVT